MGRRQANDMRAAVATKQKKVVEEVRILVVDRLCVCVYGGGVRIDGEKEGGRWEGGREADVVV